PPVARLEAQVVPAGPLGSWSVGTPCPAILARAGTGPCQAGKPRGTRSALVTAITWSAALRSSKLAGSTNGGRCSPARETSMALRLALSHPRAVDPALLQAA